MMSRSKTQHKAGVNAVLVAVVVLVLAGSLGCAVEGSRRPRNTATGEAHGDNWAVIVSTSMYWYNYRHTSNALVFYHTVKRLGIPDSNILLFLGEDHACNPRNRRPASIYSSAALQPSTAVYDEEIEVDFRGTEVTADTFIRVMTGRVSAKLPASKQLRSGPDSNIFVFMTGHGGVDFLKFRDTHVISGAELGDMFYTMHEKRRYKQVLFILETCHSESMLEHIRSPNILSIGSSSKHEDSYSRSSSPELGVMMVDEFTGASMPFLSQLTTQSRATAADYFAHVRRSRLTSHPVIRATTFPRSPAKVLLTDFLASTPVIWPLDDEIQQHLPTLALTTA
ncbi:hypothetical protein PTSG_07678 [Salpingoeca rosetta]|uniref:GPI-anchor transamidase n=1 Tax=Salpingoeca rosetta (strain ATCC 50818 / BSB-021) TaxID=946362 RepID=F2UHG4_SALR5|nr:uncharacterized protein PTSG_07678 [Salpingoeca rosetta]EGD76563.1 hypothetical protein PTSG_07678 [Salpingoeca rosetta]|eukprot:XP_004991477.1 hypothetical protein PTSG_07678 [Salpingoeca rosetta]